MRELVKFTNAHSGKSLYVDLDAVRGVAEWCCNDGTHNPFMNYASSNMITTTTTNVYMPPTECTILYCDAQTFYVTEHITEVLALIEGRDPKPARILYGQKNK